MLELQDEFENEFEVEDKLDKDLVLHIVLTDDRGRESAFYPNKEQIKKIIEHLKSVLDKSEQIEK